MRSVLLQFAVTAIIIAAFTFLTELFEFGSGWIFTWLLGVPLSIAVASNRDIRARWLMSLLLLTWTWIMCGLTATLFGFSP